ncbi:MAG: Mobile element protein [Nitrospira sp.]|jgi:transposase-like protein|nr:Mobile element protein [Nitrospira sp.]
MHWKVESANTRNHSSRRLRKMGSLFQRLSRLEPPMHVQDSTLIPLIPNFVVPLTICGSGGGGSVHLGIYAYPLVSADRNGSCFGMPRPSVPKSRRQFQPQFASEDACAEYLTACRWPDGFRCPRCGQPSAYGLAGRHRWQCASCRYQVSVTAGTVLHNSKTPLTTWFWAAYLMTTDKRGLSALLLQQHRGISRYETAWMMRHKLRRAMVNAARDPLRGEVEMDETWGGTPGRTAGQSPAQRAQRRAGSGCCRTAGAGVRSSPEGGQTRFRRSHPQRVRCQKHRHRHHHLHRWPSELRGARGERAIPMCHERSRPRSSCATEPSRSFRLPIG